MSKRLIPFGVALLCVLHASVSLASPLQVSIAAGDLAGELQVNLTNSGAEPITVLRWDTPFENTLSHPVFLITSPAKGYPYNEPVTYTGRTVKRSSVSSNHYVRMEAGATISATLALNEYYDIDAVGQYSVQFVGDIHFHQPRTLQGRRQSTPTDADTLEVASLQSNRVSINLAPDIQPRIRPPAYSACSVQEQTDIVEAATIAETLTQTALSDLRSLSLDERASSPRYNTWFGRYTASRFDQVVTNFDAIEDALANEVLQFNCNCDEEGIFAYVYSAFPYTITLCPEFRNASPNGENSRAGTIIHELSHFTVVAGTDDHAYSHLGTRALANASPDLAVANADSHEYFAENDPAIAIRRADDDPDPAQYDSITLGTTVQTSVAEGMTNTYQVTNASRIELTSLTGDADLFVYSDDQLTFEICRSRRESPTDVCEIAFDDVTYVQVAGFTAATYTLLATRDAPPANTVDAADLTLDSQFNGNVVQSAETIFRVTGAGVIELQSLSGDADLYIFSELPLSDDTLVCSSINFSNESTVDRCNVPSADARYYISVFGYETTSFSLVARSAISNVVPPQIPEPPVPQGDDPDAPVQNAGGGSSGGSLHWLTLLCLISPAGYRALCSRGRDR